MRMARPSFAKRIEEKLKKGGGYDIVGLIRILPNKNWWGGILKKN